MTEKILIFDFGSQYTQLIGRRLRELNVYSEIIPHHKSISLTEDVKGIILSGSPASVLDEHAPQFDIQKYLGKVAILAVCYGAQYVAHKMGGLVEKSNIREYGRAKMNILETSPILENVNQHAQIWMSHADSIKSLPEHCRLIASTEDIPIAAFEMNGGGKPLFALQFHPEVSHSHDGLTILKNFIGPNGCDCRGDWTPSAFVKQSVEEIRHTVGDKDQVVLGISGGVDSSVAALLLHNALGNRLHGIFVDNGLLRKHEFEDVLRSYQDLGLNIHGVNAAQEFYTALKGISDPEKKRKAIGKTFIDVFEREAKAIPDVKWLAQGTIYPDVIESVSVHGPSVTIKSHHNVGGLPEKLDLKLVEPLRMLFKDEVRRVGKEVKLPTNILLRHPFPGPGLGIRILGVVTPNKVRILQEVDYIFVQGLKDNGIYNEIWQAGAMLLPVKAVGVMGDERTYENVVALRAVTSVDGMTADWYDFSTTFLREISNKIINKVKGINRVVYDISSKPPATIEWE